MVRDSHILFNTTTSGTGSPISISPSQAGLSLEVQVEGTASSVSGNWEARVSQTSPWVQIGGFNYSTNELKPAFSKGVYSIPIGGFSEIRSNVSAVSGGIGLITAKVVG